MTRSCRISMSEAWLQNLYNWIDSFKKSESQGFLWMVATIIIYGAVITPVISQNDYVVIQNIHISELKKTHRTVILRELEFSAGDTVYLNELGYKIQRSEKRLESSNLFTLAKINISHWNTELSVCDIDISVQENWYIYPYPILELADRNFDVWRKEQNYNLDRLNYGLGMTHLNFTGWKDVLKLKIQSGYTRKMEVYYEYPYLWGEWGMTGQWLYADNTEIPYITLNNKPVFYRNEDERKLLSVKRASLGILRRPGSRFFQSLRFEYNDVITHDEKIQELNPQFLGNSKNRIRYFYIDASFRYDNTLYPLYPVSGVRWEANLRKEGLGIFNDINNTWLFLGTEFYYSLSDKWSFGHTIQMRLHFQNNPLPYILNAGIGAGSQNLTGYQLYVLDGRDYILSRNSIRLKYMDKDLKTLKFFPKQFSVMNVKLFLRMNADMGFSNDPLFRDINPLSNRPQLGYGPSADCILFNNFVFSVTYGVTQFGESGLFFEGSIGF